MRWMEATRFPTGRSPMPSPTYGRGGCKVPRRRDRFGGVRSTTRRRSSRPPSSFLASFTDLRFHEVEGSGERRFAPRDLPGQRAPRSGVDGPARTCAVSGGVGACNYDRDWAGTIGAQAGVGWSRAGAASSPSSTSSATASGSRTPMTQGGSSSVLPGVKNTPSDLGDFDLNQGIYTMMSYNDGWMTNPAGVCRRVYELRLPRGRRWRWRTIAVLQRKYGVNERVPQGRQHLPACPDANEVGTRSAAASGDAGGQSLIVKAQANWPRPSISGGLRRSRPEPGGGGYISYIDGVFSAASPSPGK